MNFVLTYEKKNWQFMTRRQTKNIKMAKSVAQVTNVKENIVSSEQNC